MLTEARAAFVISCEHATCHVPDPWRHLLADTALLQSHRGWDPGAAGMADFLGQRLETPVHHGQVTRLLADANRSASNPNVHAPAIRALPRSDRDAIIKAWHAPHHAAVTAEVENRLTAAGQVIHLSCHSFTPVLDGKRRNADIGLLYDPRHSQEQSLAVLWQHRLQASSRLRTRRNYPYKGCGDGMARTMRRLFGDAYLGFEVELSQALLEYGVFPEDLLETLHDAFTDAVEALGEFSPSVPK